jgi:cytochrome c553
MFPPEQQARRFPRLKAIARAPVAHLSNDDVLNIAAYLASQAP